MDSKFDAMQSSSSADSMSPPPPPPPNGPACCWMYGVFAKAITEYGLRQEWRQATHLLAAGLSTFGRSGRGCFADSCTARCLRSRMKKVLLQISSSTAGHLSVHFASKVKSAAKALQESSQRMPRSGSVEGLCANASPPLPSTTSRPRRRVAFKKCTHSTMLSDAKWPKQCLQSGLQADVA